MTPYCKVLPFLSIYFLFCLFLFNNNHDKNHILYLLLNVLKTMRTWPIKAQVVLHNLGEKSVIFLEKVSKIVK